MSACPICTSCGTSDSVARTAQRGSAAVPTCCRPGGGWRLGTADPCFCPGTLRPHTSHPPRSAAWSTRPTASAALSAKPINTHTHTQSHTHTQTPHTLSVHACLDDEHVAAGTLVKVGVRLDVGHCLFQEGLVRPCTPPLTSARLPLPPHPRYIHDMTHTRTGIHRSKYTHTHTLYSQSAAQLQTRAAGAATPYPWGRHTPRPGSLARPSCAQSARRTACCCKTAHPPT
jgi:hypothetical protein